MGYRNQHRRRDQHTYGDFLSIFGDLVRIATRVGPIGALTTGGLGFVVLYWGIPALAISVLTALINGRTSWTATDVAVMNFITQVFEMVFIGPSRWLGILILALCVGIAAWKAIAGVGIVTWKAVAKGREVDSER